MTTVYPVTVDAFANPTSSTNRDDPGFELDVMISNLNDAIEATEAKLGVGGSGQAAAANTVLVGTGSGASQWLTGLTTAYLAANAVTSIALVSDATATNTTSTSKVDLTGMTRTWTTGGGDVLALLLGSCSNGTVGTANELGIRLDSGSDIVGPAVTTHSAGSGLLHVAIAYFTGVSAASHTVKGRWSTSAGTLSRYGIHYLLVAEIKK